MEDEDGDEESGFDSALCLRNKETHEIENLIDDKLAEIIALNINPLVPCLFLVDACHSGTVLDLTKT